MKVVSLSLTITVFELLQEKEIFYSQFMPQSTGFLLKLHSQMLIFVFIFSLAKYLIEMERAFKSSTCLKGLPVKD